MVVLASAFVPAAPLLVPALAGGAAPELDVLRAACDRAVAEIGGVAGGVPRIVVLGSGAVTRRYGGDQQGTFRPWGVDVTTGAAAGHGPSDVDGMPLALTVGGWLLDRAAVPGARRTYQEIGDEDPDPAVPDDDVVLLVVGDGSSTRTAKAPGAFHPDAEAYDADVASALASGDPRRLGALDDERARAVGAAGARAWRVAASWWGEEQAGTARVEADEAPYGVGYLVGVWCR